MAETVDEVLDLREAAAYLKVGESTLRRLATDGEVYSFFVGGQRRFLRSRLVPAVSVYVCEYPPGSPPPAEGLLERTREKYDRFLSSLHPDERGVLIRIQAEEASQLRSLQEQDFGG